MIVEKLPFAALALGAAVLAVWGQAGEPGAFKPLAEHGVLARVVQAGYAACFYAFKTLWPVDLLPIYEFPQRFDPFEPRWLVPACIALAVTLALFARRGRYRAAWCAWLAFLIVLAPTSGLVHAGAQVAADRYTYLACMPFALLAAGGAAWWCAQRPALRGVVLQAGGLILAILCVLTFRQSARWHDDATLWSYALGVEPRSWNAAQNLGVARLKQATATSAVEPRAQLLHESLELFDRAHALAPHPQLLINQGMASMLLSDVEPGRRTEHLERSRAAWQAGLAQARAEVPTEWRLQYAKVLLALGRRDEAQREVERATAPHQRTTGH